MDARRVSRVSAILLAAWILLAGQLAGGQNVWVEPYIPMVKNVFAVPAEKYQPFEMTLGGGAVLAAEVYTQGGLERQLIVRFTDAPNFQRFKAGQPFNDQIYRVKTVVVKRLGGHEIPRHEFRVPGSGTYYLVLDNSAGTLFSQKVNVLAYAIPIQATEGSQRLEGAFQRFYNGLKREYAFDDFRIEIRRCNTVNAYSDPKGNIRLCLEVAQDTIEARLPGALAFIFFHELGHSLLKLWGDPAWSDEDIADQVATALSIMAGEPKMALEAAEWFRRQDSFTAATYQLAHGDPHTVPVERARRIDQWVGEGYQFARMWHSHWLPRMRTEALKGLQSSQKQWVDLEKLRAELSRR